jgi:hypothetical protein
MNVRKKALLRGLAALLLGLINHGLAQDGFAVTLVTRDGTHVPFTIDVSAGRDTRGEPHIRYRDGGGAVAVGQFMANIGDGNRTPIPFTLIARVDLVAPGERSVWRATLSDGRVFDGAVDSVGGSGAALILYGVNQFGAAESFLSYPRDPERQPLIAVIFDPDAVAAGEVTAQPPAAHADVDRVALRNGDVLSGSILTTEFTIQASYGKLTFTSEQLATITIESAAGKTDQVVLKVGDSVSGVLQNTTIEMTLSSGATITLEKGNIASITFGTE